MGWSGSEGGCSRIFAQPSWQTGIATHCPYYRAVPDVSFAATGDSIVFNGSWTGVQGTSWSSPIFAAMQIEIVQEINQKVGNANYSIYSAFKSHGYGSIFRDITTGNNGVPAGPGYDLVTGIGTIDGQNGSGVRL